MTSLQATNISKVSGRAAGRLPLWDNARFLAVTLVVMGHAIQRLTSDSDSALTLYLVIYAFHMPVFSLVSGYFSKSDPPTLRSMTRIFSDLIVPYIVMETAWSMVMFMIDGKPSFDPTHPSWTLWFLLSLATFRVVLPYLALLRWPLTISLAVSVGVGYLSGIDSTFALARTLGFLPFFVLGWKLSQTSVVGWWLSLGRRVWIIRLGAITVFTIFTMFVATNIASWRAFDISHWLFYNSSYAELGVDSAFAGGIRLIIIAIAVVLCAAFLSLVPRRATAISSLGAATMYVYLLHSFVLYPLRESGILGGPHSSIVWLTLLCIASVAIAFVLASAPVRKFFRPIIEPRTHWLFTDAAQEKSGSLPRVAPRVDLARRGS